MQPVGEHGIVLNGIMTNVLTTKLEYSGTPRCPKRNYVMSWDQRTMNTSITDKIACMKWEAMTFWYSNSDEVPHNHILITWNALRARWSDCHIAWVLVAIAFKNIFFFVENLYLTEWSYDCFWVSKVLIFSCQIRIYANFMIWVNDMSQNSRCFILCNISYSKVGNTIARKFKPKL